MPKKLDTKKDLQLLPTNLLFNCTFLEKSILEKTASLPAIQFELDKDLAKRFFDIIETIEYKNYNIELCYDTYPDDPRKFNENLGFMACFHKRYNLGDKHSFNEPQDLLDWIEANKDKIYYLPLYLYDHGNITISTNPFSCQWDSGQIGFIYITKEKAEAEGIKEPYEALEAETKEYDYYLRGDTYGVRILDSEGEVIDSQFGYIGDRQIAINDAEGMIDTYN